MTNIDINYKMRLLRHCIATINERIAAIAAAMATAQLAANNEEKSSAGDKYETSRAMSHREKDMQARQLVANQNELAAVLSIDCFTIKTIVTAGCIVSCTELQFFIAAGLGKINFEGLLVYLVSPQAPLAKTLMGKRVGDSVVFNKLPIIITNIF